jgi:RNA polymerase sigma factor (sigma-70 family)
LAFQSLNTPQSAQITDEFMPLNPESPYRWQHVVELCQQQNRFAQNRLYDAFFGKLYRLCLRYVRHESDAEEVLMNGFLKVFKLLPEFEYRDDNSLEVWLKRIVVNEALMHLRQQKALPQWAEVDEAEGVTAPFDAPDAAIGAEAIYEAILELPTGYRTVFNLFVVEGYSHEEIANQLEINIGTSKSQLSKARTLLQKLLTNRGYERYGTV